MYVQIIFSVRVLVPRVNYFHLHHFSGNSFCIIDDFLELNTEALNWDQDCAFLSSTNTLIYGIIKRKSDAQIKLKEEQKLLGTIKVL
jgi:hypothetical protein